MKDFATYIATFGVLTAAIWAGIHGFQKLTRIGDGALAWFVCIIGILGGVTAQGVGFVPAPVPGAWSWVASGFFGLLSAFSGAAVSELNLARAVTPKPKE